MKLFKNTKAFLAAALLVAGLCLTTSCSSPASDKTDDGGSGSGGLNNYSSSGSIDDGNAIAYYLCESLCSSSKESVKLCFYGDSTFKLRQTSLDDDDYSQRYDFLLGTYEGDPTKDGKIIINFTKIRDFQITYTGNPSDLDNVETLEDFSKLDQSKISGEYIYKDVSREFEPDIEVTIKDGNFTLKKITFSGTFFYSSYSSLDFSKTDAKDRGPYRYIGVSRRDNDPRRTEWTIPEGYTSIADNGFSSSDNKLKYLKKITLPSTIKKIGYCSFYNLKGLEEINIPEACTEIGSSAFCNCTSLKEITIPKNIKSIGSSAFSKSYSYSSNDEEEKEPVLVLSFAEGTTKILDSAFEGSYSSDKTLIKTVKIPASVKVIGNRAFRALKFTGPLVIPNGVEEIGDYAFYNAEIKELTIPTSLKKIGNYAFSDIKKLTLAEGFTSVSEEEFKNLGIKELKLPSTLKTIGAKAFCSNSIKELVIPEGVTEIGDEAFSAYDSYSSEKLEKITLPSTLKKIGTKAFYYNACEKIEIPEGVEEIGSNAFYSYYYSDDPYLKEITLPSTLKTLGSSAVNYEKLETLKFNGTLFELVPLLENLSVNSYSNLKIYCGDEEVTAFFTKGLDYNLSNSQWEVEESSILLTLKSDKTFTKKTGSKIETGLWSTDTSSSPRKITFYQKGKDAEEYEYEYSYYSDTLKITDLAEYNAVKEFSVTEKKVLTTEKWTDSSELESENGQYVYYQYYLEKAGGNSSYLTYIDTPVYYQYYDSDSGYIYENKYYMSCKDELKKLLNSYSSRSYYSSKYNNKTGEYESFVYVTSDPQQEQQQEED